MDLAKLETGYVLGQSHRFFCSVLYKSQVNIDARRAIVTASLQSEGWLVSAMNCRGTNGPKENDRHTSHSCAWDLACKSCLARPEDCRADNGKGEIVSQRNEGMNEGMNEGTNGCMNECMNEAPMDA